MSKVSFHATKKLGDVHVPRKERAGISFFVGCYYWDQKHLRKMFGPQFHITTSRDKGIEQALRKIEAALIPKPRKSRESAANGMPKPRQAESYTSPIKDKCIQPDTTPADDPQSDKRTE